MRYPAIVPFLQLLLCLAPLSPGAAYAGESAGVRVETLLSADASWNGQVLPVYPEGQPRITILRIQIAPGTRLPMHKHPVINAGVLLGGELTVVAEDGATLRLKAGDALVELVDTWHYGRNDGDVPADIVVFYAGTADQAITVTRATPH